MPVFSLMRFVLILIRFCKASLLNYAKLRNVYLDEFDHAAPSEKCFLSRSSWGSYMKIIYYILYYITYRLRKVKSSIKILFHSIIIQPISPYGGVFHFFSSVEFAFQVYCSFFPMPYHGSVNFKFATDMRRKCFSENGLFFDTFTTEAGEKMCQVENTEF